MRTPEQAFKAYYASMTDADLLAVARNRSSFIPLAQALLAEEVTKRKLEMPAARPGAGSSPGLFTTLRQLFRRQTGSEPSTNPPPTPQPNETPVAPTTRPRARAAHAGATEDQVSMVGTVPERVNKHGAKIEDMAGTGQHDSLGG